MSAPPNLVIDASVLVAAVAIRSPAGAVARDRISEVRRHAPHLIDAEVGNALRAMTLRGEISGSNGAGALAYAADLIDVRHDQTRALASRAWELRSNASFYDALYVALAEALDCQLLTFDRRLVRAFGGHELIVTLG